MTELMSCTWVQVCARVCVRVFLHGRRIGTGQSQVQRQPPWPLLHLGCHWTAALSVGLLLAPHWSVSRGHEVDRHDDFRALHLSAAALSLLVLFLLLFPLLLWPHVVSFLSFFLLLFLLFFDLFPEMSGFSLNDWLQGLTPPLTGGRHLVDKKGRLKSMCVHRNKINKTNSNLSSDSTGLCCRHRDVHVSVPWQAWCWLCLASVWPVCSDHIEASPPYAPLWSPERRRHGWNRCFNTAAQNKRNPGQNSGCVWRTGRPCRPS